MSQLSRPPHENRRPPVGIRGPGRLGASVREFVFTAAVTYCAYRGLDSYVWTGVAWLLHTAWDVLHHLRGAPIIPFASHSSLGCAICDPVIAVWCLRGGPSLPTLISSWFSRRPSSASDASRA